MMLLETIRIRNKTLLLYQQDMLEDFYIADFEKELSSIDTLSNYGEFIVIGGLVTSSLVGTYYKSALYYYLHEKIKSMNITIIDILIGANAIIQHFTTLFLTLTYAIGLGFNLTFSDHMPRAWCNVPWYVGVYAGAYRAVGSLSVAILRLLYIKSNTFLSQKIDTHGKIKVALTILLLSLTLNVGLTIGFGLGNGPASRKQVAWNWCIGSSEQIRETNHNYAMLTGTVESESDLVSQLCLSVTILAVMVELTCYLFLFGHLYSHDKSMLDKKLLGASEIKKRCQRNAMTFLGQFYAFVVESIIYFSFMYTYRANTSIYARLAVSFGAWMEFGIVSIVEVMTSNSLRAYLYHNY